MVTVKEIIAQQKKELTEKEYKQLIKMCKRPKSKMRINLKTKKKNTFK